LVFNVFFLVCFFVFTNGLCVQLTVRQVLTDSALARLPSVWPMRKKLAIVDDVLVRRCSPRSCA
jgi:hypothetical protein